MKTYELSIETDVRDIQLLNSLIEDNCTVCNSLTKHGSGFWTFESEDLEEVEEMENEINEIVEDRCNIYTDISDRTRVQFGNVLFTY